MRTSLIALGFLALGLAQCSSDRGLFVGDERTPDAGEGGEPGETGGSVGNGGNENLGGASGSANRGGASGSESRGGSGADAGEPSTGGSENSGGTESRGGNGAEAGESAGGTAGTAAHGGSDAAGSTGEGGTGTAARGGMGGNGAQAGSGTAARGGTNDGGRAGSSNAGSGGKDDVDCEALAREYIERLALAQQCSPTLTFEQCTVKMPDDFRCPCPTFVNPAREGDIRRLNQILEYTMQCIWACPAVVCPNPTRGTCSADAIVAADGRCKGVL